MNIHEKALFLGPKSENSRFFKDMLKWMIDDHLSWRNNYHPDNKPTITHSEKRKDNYGK